MIRSFKHKELRKFHETGSPSGIQSAHVQTLRMILAALDTAVVIEDMDLPGYQLGLWAVTVNKNWRVTFSFKNGDVYIVDYEDSSLMSTMHNPPHPGAFIREVYLEPFGGKLAFG